jgi:hypothetical protein
MSLSAMKLLSSFGAGLVLLSLCSCSTYSNFKLIARQAPADKTQAGSPVSGTDCRMFLGFGSLEQAVRNAIEKSPGAVGLKDVHMYYSVSLPPLFFCMEVEGVPMK